MLLKTTYFKNITATLDGKPLNLTCQNYHCDVNISDVAYES